MINDIEQALTELLAKITSLTEDETIFKGQLPDEVNNAAAVSVTTQLLDNTVNFINLDCQFMARYSRRADCLSLQSKLAAALPRYGVTVSGVEFASITFRSGAAIFKDALNGAAVWCLSVNLLVSAR